MEYFFILGRNPLLSQLEIISYLESNDISYSEEFFIRNSLVINLDKEHDFNIQDFGGTIKIGKILFQGSEKEFKKFLKEEDFTEKEKFSYSIMGNYDEEILKEKFKQEKRKAIIRKGRKSLQLQKGDFVSIPNAEINFFIYQNQEKIYFGIAEQDYSYSMIKERDMKKPIRRESLAISPRLAKILINLSQAKKNELLLDPFCGVGGILQEALIKGINVYGLDKNSNAISQCKQNLKWLEKKYQINANYKLLSIDSRKAPNIKVDAIATEPSLGKILRKKPNDNEAKEIIKNFENLIIGVLQRMKKIKKPYSKIAITAPYIKKFSIDAQRIIKQTGLRIHKIKDCEIRIRESRPDQFIAREIFVFV